MTTQTAHRATADRWARVVTEVSAPAVLVTALLLVVGWHAAGGHGAGMWWALLASVFATGLPFAYIVRGVRRGRYTDHHVGVREQRRRPLLVALASVLLGLAVTWLTGAPAELRALITAGAVGLIVCVVISHWWKMSIHTAVAAGSTVILLFVFGGRAVLAWQVLVGGALVAVVAWARVRLRDHTPAQVLGGLVIGAAIAATVFPALR